MVSLTEPFQESLQPWFRAIVQEAVDAIVAADAEGRVRLMNPAAERLLGETAEEVVGRWSLERLLGKAAEEAKRLLLTEHCGGSGRLEGVRIEIVRGEDERLPVHCSGTLLTQEGSVMGLCLVLRDLSRREEMEQRLAEAQQRLAPTERQRLLAELRGTAAHELNQPLTSILAYATLLGRRLRGGGAEARAIERIRSEAERMAEIVRKIGEMTRYQTKDYVGTQRILDLDRQSDRPPSAPRGEG